MNAHVAAWCLNKAAWITARGVAETLMGGNGRWKVKVAAASWLVRAEREACL